VTSLYQHLKALHEARLVTGFGKTGIWRMNPHGRLNMAIKAGGLMMAENKMKNYDGVIGG
jgi:hypothetical protein